MYILLDNPLELTLDNECPVFFDIETDIKTNEILLAQFYQFGHTDVQVIKKPEPLKLYAAITNHHIVSHSINFELTSIQNKIFKKEFNLRDYDDTLLLSRLKFSNKKIFTLGNCINYALGYDPYEQAGIIKSEMQKSDFNNPTKDQIKYACFDVFYLSQLYDAVRDMRAHPSYRLDKRIIMILMDMQVNGLPIDSERVNKELDELNEYVKDNPLPYNINAKSSKQVCEYLGTTTSAELELKKEAERNPNLAKDIKDILHIRKCRTNISFLKKLQNKNIYKGTFNVTAVSGRTKSSNENLQNIPRHFRHLLIAPEGYKMVYSDLSQLEIRCAAAISNDTYMAQQLVEGVDIHTLAAQVVFKCDEPTKEQRTIAKMCNFSLLYGAGALTFQGILLKQADIYLPVYKVQSIIKQWKLLWGGIRRWQDKCIDDFNRGKIASTPLGKEYAAKIVTDYMNIQVQGMGADVAKYALLLMMKRIDDKTWFRNFLHDSYTFIIKDDVDHVDLCKIIAESITESWKAMLTYTPCKIKIPMPVNVTVGHTLHDVETGSNLIYNYNLGD